MTSPNDPSVYDPEEDAAEEPRGWSCPACRIDVSIAEHAATCRLKHPVIGPLVIGATSSMTMGGVTLSPDEWAQVVRERDAEKARAARWKALAKRLREECLSHLDVNVIVCDPTGGNDVERAAVVVLAVT